MTDKPDIDTAAQWARTFAQARGLERAYALYPDVVEAAVARGTRALSPLPTDFSAVTEPAVWFDPASLFGAAASAPSPQSKSAVADFRSVY